MKEYEGPVSEVDSIVTIYSDSSFIRVKVSGPKQIELKNGNREFTKGVKVAFFDEREQPTAILTANFGRFMKESNNYLVSGNVQMNNFAAQQKLNTEELFWNPTKHEINTDKFVRVETKSEVITGTGLTAQEDMSTYKILKTSGIFDLK